MLLRSFPVGSIHIIGVDSEISEENKHIASQLKDHYFICANNGIMSMICSEINPQKIVEINIHDKISTSFPVLDVFVKVAAHIARGGTLEVIGKVSQKSNPLKILPLLLRMMDHQLSRKCDLYRSLRQCDYQHQKSAFLKRFKKDGVLKFRHETTNSNGFITIIVIL